MNANAAARGCSRARRREATKATGGSSERQGDARRWIARSVFSAVLLLPVACKPARYLFGWTPSLAPDSTVLHGGVVLVGAGDIGFCGLGGARATAILLDQIPGAVFTAGDNAYPDGTPSDFARCYAPYWGRHFERTRPTPGNHEYRGGQAPGYFGYFGERAGPPGLGYYSYELGAWHIVALNSNIDAAPGSAQERWLRGDLAAHPALCTLAYWHHALFSSSVDGSPVAASLWRALEEAGAEIVITGHHHAYERFAPQTAAGVLDTAYGIREFVVGTGGGGLDWFARRPAANSESRYNANYGLLKLELYRESYRWVFVSVNGHVRDEGRGRCHDRRPPG